jgi:hypothetical protein
MARKLIILGASYTVVTPVIFIICPMIYGFYEAIYVFPTAAAHNFDVQKAAAEEFVWITRLMVFCTIMGFTGVLILATGIIALVASPAPQTSHPK